MGITDDLRKAALAGVNAARDWAARSDDDVSFEDMQSVLIKGGIAQPTEEKPRAMFHDPYSILDWGGWRQRPSILTYDTLRAMATSCTPIAAIINLRVNQLSQFARPQQGDYDRGYRVVLRDRRDRFRTMTKVEKKRATEIERMLETTGVLLPHENATDRDSFRTFLRKGVRDTLTYDQLCHPAGTLVQMASGEHLAIEAIQPGDMVITHLGRARRVTSVKSRKYNGKMIRLWYRGQDVVQTEGHPLYVERGPHMTVRGAWKNPTYNREWVAAGELEAGQYLTAPDVAPFGDNTDTTAEMARVLGLYAGNGHRSGVAAVWTFHEDADASVDAVLAVFPDAIVDPYKDRAAVSVRVNGQGEWFASRCGEGSGSKRVPALILQSAGPQRRAFLRGLLESDGHFTAAGTGATFTTTSLALRGGFTLLCAMENVFVSWTENSNAEHGWSRCWVGHVSGSTYRDFARAEGLPFTQPARPRNPAVHADGYHYLRINQVESFQVEDEQVFNMEVEEDHSYLANGIASHNCFEKQRDRAGKVSRFICLPSETIRPAVVDIEHVDAALMADRVAYVQIYESTVIAEFAQRDIAWCIMNPRSDLRSNGFGFSPIEQIVRLVSSWLFGFEYNTRFFTQGSAIKGLLNIKGAVPDRQMRAFRRMWYAQLAGVNNAWRTPILNSEDVQWVNMHSTNREMEFSAWMDWLTKLICAVYGVDPVEINFQFGNTGQKSAMGNQNNEDKVVESKDKGLLPLVDHFQDSINSHILWDLEPDFEFVFQGLMRDSEDSEREARIKESAAFKTVDEVRAEMELPALPDKMGQMIRDATWLQWASGIKQEQQQPPGGDEMGGDDSAPAPAQLGSGDDSEPDDLLHRDDDASTAHHGFDDDDDLLHHQYAKSAARDVERFVLDRLRKAAVTQRVEGDQQEIEIEV